jgi:hypothetical protein
VIEDAAAGVEARSAGRYRLKVQSSAGRPGIGIV